MFRPSLMDMTTSPAALKQAKQNLDAVGGSNRQRRPSHSSQTSSKTNPTSSSSSVSLSTSQSKKGSDPLRTGMPSKQLDSASSFISNTPSSSTVTQYTTISHISSPVLASGPARAIALAEAKGTLEPGHSAIITKTEPVISRGDVETFADSSTATATSHNSYQASQNYNYPSEPKVGISKGKMVFASVFGLKTKQQKMALSQERQNQQQQFQNQNSNQVLSMEKLPRHPLNKKLSDEPLKISLVQRVVHKVAKRFGKKLNSKSPKEDIPITWEEFALSYANNEIDIDDPPLPPQEPSSDPAKPTPFESRVYVAPHPANEAERQAAVDKLDLFGRHQKVAAQAGSTTTLTIDGNQNSPKSRRGHHQASSSVSSSINPPPMTATSSRSNSISSVLSGPADSLFGASSTTSSAATVPDLNALTADAVLSLENHPPFRKLVTRCKEMFGTRVGMLTVLDNEEQLFLATGGMPEGIDSLPRSVTFCSHAILNEDKGLVVLDTQKDWRFANNMPSTHLGARFYAGVPLLAPTFGDPDAPNVAIGTLCVVDDQPREAFTDEERQILHRMAAQASKEIEGWVNERMSSKMRLLEARFQQQHQSTKLASQSSSMDLAALISSLPNDAALHNSSSSTKADDETSRGFPPDQKRERRGSVTSEYSSTSQDLQTAPHSAAAAVPPMQASQNSVPAVAAPDTPKSSKHTRGPSDSASIASYDSTGLVRGPPVAPPPTAPLPMPEMEGKKTPTAGERGSIFQRSSSLQPGAFQVVQEAPVAVASSGNGAGISPELQKVFDRATSMLAKALQLDFVYLVAIDLARVNASGGLHGSSISSASSPFGDHHRSPLRLLSAWNLPNPKPSFDPGLHLKALRAAEGGLLYRNPNFSPSSNSASGNRNREASSSSLFDHQSQGSRASGSGGDSFASGMLIPVLEVRRVGYVLSGYTKDGARTFGRRDLTYFGRFAEELESFVTRVGKRDVTSSCSTSGPLSSSPYIVNHPSGSRSSFAGSF